jgi:hypothetical protein
VCGCAGKALKTASDAHASWHDGWFFVELGEQPGKAACIGAG